MDLQILLKIEYFRERMTFLFFLIPTHMVLMVALAILAAFSLDTGMAL